MEDPERLLDTKHAIGFELVAILSSLFSSCILFDIGCEQAEELKHADVEQGETMIPLITFEINFREYVCEMVFCVNIFDFDLWVKNGLVK